MKKLIIYRFFLPAALMIFISCSNQAYHPLEREGNCPLIIEARTFGGIFGGVNGFDLKISNTGETGLKNCSISFDHKYKHSLNGLYSHDHGLIKDSVFLPHAGYALIFSGDESNFVYFNLDAEKYVPSEITIESNGCASTWKLK
jgi:hypothetical protein